MEKRKNRKKGPADSLLKAAAGIIAENPAAVPARPSVKRTGRTETEIVILTDPACRHPYLDQVHLQLERLLLPSGFSVRLSRGDRKKELAGADACVAVCGTDRHEKWERILREEGIFHMFLSPERGRNRVSFDADGAWIRFFQILLEEKTEHVFHLRAPEIPKVCDCEPEREFRKFFPEQIGRLTFHDAEPERRRMPENSVVLSEDPHHQTFSVPAAAWFLPAPCRFRFLPAGVIAQEILRCLFRQMESGVPDDPGAVVPVRLLEDGEIMAF